MDSIRSGSRLRFPEGVIPAGTILTDGKSYLAISTTDGAVLLDEIQLSGKKRMDVKDFLLGFRDAGLYTTDKGTSAAVKQQYKI